MGTGLLCLAAPAAFVAQFAAETLPPVPLELICWYGVLLWVLTFFVLRDSARQRQPPARSGSGSALVRRFRPPGGHLPVLPGAPGVGFSFVLMLFFTVTLAVLRSVWVYRYYRHTL